MHYVSVLETFAEIFIQYEEFITFETRIFLEALRKDLTFLFFFLLARCMALCLLSSQDIKILVILIIHCVAAQLSRIVLLFFFAVVHFTVIIDTYFAHTIILVTVPMWQWHSAAEGEAIGSIPDHHSHA